MKECLINSENNNNDDTIQNTFQRRHSRTLTKKNRIDFLKFRGGKNEKNEIGKVPQIKQVKFNKNPSFNEIKNNNEVRTVLTKKKRFSVVENFSDKKKFNPNIIYHATNDILKRENLSLYSLKKIGENSPEKSLDEDLFSEKTNSYNTKEDSLIKKNNILNNNGRQVNKEKIRIVKYDYLLLISILYYSIFLLMAKILNSIKLPEIPSVSIILFLIYFHELILSTIFMSIDHIDVLANFDTKDLYHYLIHIFIEYIKVFLIIRGLRHLSLLSFIVIIYLNPLLTSLIILKQKMEEITKMDKIFAVFGIFVILYHFLF